MGVSSYICPDSPSWRCRSAGFGDAQPPPDARFAQRRLEAAALLLATNTGQAVAPHLLKLKYNPLTDLQPIGLVAIMPNLLVVSQQALERLAAELTRTRKLPDVQARIKGFGGEITLLDVEPFAAMNRTEYERHGRLVREG